MFKDTMNERIDSFKRLNFAYILKDSLSATDLVIDNNREEPVRLTFLQSLLEVVLM